MRRSTWFMARYSMSALLLALGACAAQVDGAPAIEDEYLEAGCTALGSPIIAHACTHVTDGSAMSVNASASLSFAGSSPNINLVHTYWTVNIPGSGSSRQGAVKYTPASSGDWAFFQNGSVPFRIVRHSTGAEVLPVLTHSISTCTGIARVRVYPLTGGVAYRVIIGPTSAATTRFVIEKVSNYTAFYYADADADGYGNVSTEVATACVPPTGYITDSSDCNDADASIRPGVSDPPGLPDLNCDGVP